MDLGIYPCFDYLYVVIFHNGKSTRVGITAVMLIVLSNKIVQLKAFMIFAAAVGFIYINGPPIYSVGAFVRYTKS